MKLINSIMLLAGAIMIPLRGQADVHDHFSRALAALPAEIFQSREPAAFVNLHALSTVFGTTDFTAAQAQRAVVGLESSALRAMGTADSKNFEAKAGFAPYEVEFFGLYGQRPEEAVIWGGPRGFPQEVAARLPEIGFKTLDEAQDLFANGDLGVFNPASIDPENPWVGPTGTASIVKVAPTIVYQASSAKALTRATAQPSALDTPDGQAFVGIMPTEGSYLMQAFLFSADFGRAVGEGISGSSVVYRAGVLADLQSPDGPVTLLALSYDSCGEAEKALQVPWPQEPTGLRRTTAQSGETCLALWQATGGEGVAENTSFLTAMEGMNTRAFAPVALSQ